MYRNISWGMIYGWSMIYGWIRPALPAVVVTWQDVSDVMSPISAQFRLCKRVKWEVWL